MKGTGEDNLTIYWVDKDNARLVPLDNHKIDKAKGIVSADTPHFSTYILGDNTILGQSIIPGSLFNTDIIFAVDRSYNMGIKDADKYRYKLIETFVNNMNELNAGTDKLKIALVDFSEFAQRKESLTSDATVLAQKLAGMKAVIPGGSTNIAESLWIPRFMFSQRTGKKLLVILTDGKDTSGNLRQGIEKIAESLDPKIMVNTVAVGNDTDSELLRNMASITGGAYFTLNTSDEVQANQDIEEIYRKIIKQTVIQDMTEPPDELDDAVIKLMLNSEDNRGLDNEEALRLYALKTNANILTGNYVENATDISIGNITGMNISLGRTYNSDAANESTAIGNGWRLNYDSNIKIKDNIGIVTANGLNLRTQPVSNLETNNIITVLSRNKTVEFLDTQPQTVGGIQWRKVKVFDGTASYEGYVACTYIKTITTGAEVTYGSGTKAVFQAILNGQGNVTGYEPVFGVHDKLNKTASGFEVVRKDQTKYTYNTYDSINAVYRLSSIADRNGNKLEMYYDPTKEKLLEVTDPVGRTIALVYNDDDKLTKVFDTSGRCVEYSYDEKGNLLTVRYPGGNKTTYKYKECREATRDGNNYSYVNAYRLSSITDANGHTALRNEYDVFGRLVKQYDANNNVRYQIYKDVYRYENGDIASSNSELARYYIDENGYESKILLNPITNKIKSETDVLGQTTEYSYQMDYKGNGTGWTDISNLDFDTEAQNSLYYSAISTGNKPERITIKDKNGYSTQYEYDERGNTLSIKDIGLTQNNTVTMEYDSNNNLTQKTDRKNNTTTYTYIDNKLNTVEDPYGNTTTYTYSDCELSTGMTAYGLLSTETQRRKASSGNLIEFKTTGYNYQYDNVNEVETIKTTDTLNNVHTTRYDKLGRVFMITDANGHATRYYYDVAGRFTREVDHLGYATEIKYDGAGNKRFVTDKNFNTTEYIYDDVNQLIKVIDPQGNSKTFKYDASGKKIEEINESGAELQYEYDALGRLYQVIDPLGNTTTYAEYDGNGNVRKVLDSLNRLTEYQYDRYNRRIKEIMLLGMINQYSYDAASNLEQFTDPDGKITKYEYDSLNRKVRVTDGYNPNYPKDTSGIYSGPFDAETGELVGNIETTLSYDVYVSEGKKIEKITQTNPMGHSTVEEYDALGRLIKVTDPDSNYASYQYDAVGNLKTETDKRGYTTTYSYDELDRLVRITDPLGNSIAKGYDPSGNLILETDKKGRNTEYGYDKNNRLLAKTDALGNMTAYTYDKAGNLKTVKDPCANTTTYYYDKLNRLTAEKDPEGNMKYYGYDNVGNKIYQSDKIEYSSYDAFAWPVETENGTIYRALTMYKYDELGRLVKVYDTENNLIQENGYDIAGNLVSQKDANGNIVEYEYNALNRLKKTIYPGDGTIYSNTITYMYDPAGNLKEETDSTGTVIKYNYDNLYRLIKKTQEGQNGEYPIELNWIYDQNGNKIYEKDGNEVATQYGYDALGRLVTTNTAGKTTSYSYDSNDNLIEENDWRNNKYIKIYDELNRLIEEKDPYGKTIRRLKYYANSLTKESYDALNYMTRFEYDKNGSLIKTTDPEGNIVKQVYDANGSLIQKYDGKNNKTTYAYDHLNRLEYILDAEGTITSYTYDNNGNMLTQTDGRGNITTYEYNAANKVTKRIDHGGMNDNTKTQSYTYNADGSLKTKVDRNGKTATYTYDVHGRLKKQTVGSIITDYTYDNNGNQLEIRTGAETTVRTYDAFNRVISKTVTNIGTSTYEYDIISSVEAGCVKENSLDPKGNSVTKVYDRVGRLKEVTSEGKTTTYTYNDNGSRKSSVYFDGSREDYTYYRNGLLHTLVNRKADGTVIDNYSYTYDKSGNQTTKTDNKGITWYTYDSLNRLETVTEPDGRLTEYTYDGAGNRATEKVAYQGDISLTTYSYNEQNRLVSSTVKLNAVTVEKRNYEYDYNGNQLTVTKIPYDNGVPQPQQILATNTYDDLNQLIQTETYNGNTSTTNVNIYNGEGLRVGKNVNGTLTRYLYEYDKVVLELDDNGDEIAHNIYGTNLLMRSVDGDSYYYMYNGHADVTALINTVTGSIDATYYYDAFGNITESTGSVNNNITYAGYQYDEETGLYYLNARHYDPKIARFLQEDTYLGDPNDPLSLNLYAYAANNPITYYDPDGHLFREIRNAYYWLKYKINPDSRPSKPTEDAIVAYNPNWADKADDFLDNAGDKTKAFLVGFADKFGADALNRISTRVMYNDWTPDYSKTPSTMRPALTAEEKQKFHNEIIRDILGEGYYWTPDEATENAYTIGGFGGQVFQYFLFSKIAAGFTAGSKVAPWVKNLINNSSAGAASGAIKSYGEGNDGTQVLVDSLTTAAFSGATSVAIDKVVTPIVKDAFSVVKGIKITASNSYFNTYGSHAYATHYSTTVNSSQLNWAMSKLRAPVNAILGTRGNNIFKALFNGSDSGVGGGKPEVFVRYGSETEALASKEANGLVPKMQNGNPTRGGKWISEKAQPRDVGSLGNPKNYTHEITIETKPGAKQWLESKGINYEYMIGGESKNSSNVFIKSNEHGSFGIGADLIKEFNDNWVTKITYKKIR